MLYRQPPAHSPLDSGVVASGLRAWLSGREGARRRADRALEQRFDPEAHVWTDSGTTALRLALAAAAAGEGSGAAALPAYGCYELATAADGADVPVALYDLDPSTLEPDADSLERALDAGVSSLVAAYLFAYPLDWRRIRAAAGRHGALLIEDAAQASGCTYGTRRAGTMGDLAVLSFGRGKGVTGGSGGALLAHTDRGADALARLAAGPDGGGAGLGDALAVGGQLVFSSPRLYGLPASIPWLGLGETTYGDPREPRGSSLFALGAIPASWALEGPEVEARREVARRLLDAVREADGLRAVEPSPAGTAGFLRLPVRVSPARRGELGSAAGRRLGVQTGYPKPLARLAGFRPRCVNADGSFPGASELAASLHTLPTHSRLRARDVERLERALV